MRMISLVLVLLAFTIPLTGCSVIGLAIGAASDAHASKEFTRLTPLVDLSEGSPLTLITAHGDTVKGELVGLKEIPEYDKIYRERVSGTPLGDVIPAPQVHVTVVAHEKAQLFGPISIDSRQRFSDSIQAWSACYRAHPDTAPFSLFREWILF